MKRKLVCDIKSIVCLIYLVVDHINKISQSHKDDFSDPCERFIVKLGSLEPVKSAKLYFVDLHSFRKTNSMPYILIRGNLASYSHKYPWRVLVSGLKAADIEQLGRFPSGGYSDESTIVYLQHPCVILTALELLGYSVVASSSTAVKQDYNEYMWTMRRDFPEQAFPADTASVVDRDNISNIGREAFATLSNKTDE